MIRPLFNKYQRELVAFANTNYGRDFISQFGGNELKENYPVVKVTPDGIHQWLGKNTFRAVFYTRSPYVKLLGETLTMVDIANLNKYKISPKERPLVIPHFMGETMLLRKRLPQIYLNSTTFYPDAHPESTSVDGWAGMTAGGGQDWATLWGGAGDSNDTTSTSTYGAWIAAHNTTNKFEYIIRTFFLFDTHTLTGGATISAVVMSIYNVTNTNDDLGGSHSIRTVTTTPATNTNLVNADYTQTGTTAQTDADVTVAALIANNNAYNDWTFNATGIGNVSKTSISKFGQRTNNDITNTAPTWSSFGECGTYHQYAEGTNKPKLVVTYILPVATTNYLNDYRRGSSTI